MHPTKYQYTITYLSMAGILFLYVGTILMYSSHMPISDDYGAVLLFLNNYVQIENGLDKLQSLFLQHNEHRIVFNRLIEVLQLQLFGEVNFKVLILIGNLGWLLTLYILWVYLKKKYIMSPLAFLPVVLIMLSFSHSALMTWAMASLQNYWQLYFSILTIYFMTTHRYIYVVIFMSIAFFTGGGGIALMPLVFLYYLSQKSWQKSIGILLVSLVLLYFYFIELHYQSHKIDRDILSIMFENYQRFILYGLSFLGNIAEANPLASMVGAFLVGASLFLIKKTFRYNPFIAWSILFICVIAFMASLVRSEGGATQALSSRYAIYSSLFMVLVYLQYILYFKQKRAIVYIGLMVGITTFIFYFFTTQTAFEGRKNKAETSLDNISIGRAESILRASKKLNVFSSWGKVKLPSSLLNVPKMAQDYTFSFTINDKNITSKNLNRRLNILPSIVFLHLHGWILSKTLNNKVCAMIVNNKNHKQLFYPYKVEGNKSYFNYHFSVGELLSGTHSIELQAIHSNCSKYSNITKVKIHKSSVDDMLSLPVESMKLKGWIDKFHVKRNKIQILGWYAKAKEKVLSKTMFLDIDGKKFLVKYGYARHDVSDALGSEVYAHSGFKITIDKDKVGTGMHHIKVLLLSDDLKTLLEDTHTYTFTVK